MILTELPKFDNEKPILKIDFIGFSGIIKTNNFFTHILQKDFNVVISDKPDLLFFSDAGGSTGHKLYTCKKIFFTGESVLPSSKNYDGAFAPLEIDYDRHQRLPYYVIGTECNPKDLIKDENFTSKILNENRQGCGFMVSNIGRRAKYRTNFYTKLSKKMSVFSGGRALNNIGKNIPRDGYSKRDFLSQYKFSLAMENKSAKGYATEKIIDAMWSRAIPIYHGDTLINEQFNSKSFINISDFKNTSEAIEYIIEVDNNAELYKKYLNEPYFINNKPNKWFNEEIYLNFIKKILDSPKVSTESKLSRYTLTKRMHY